MSEVPTPTAEKKAYRSKKNRVLAGFLVAFLLLPMTFFNFRIKAGSEVPQH